MIHTLEVRWFGTPPLPPALHEWFQTLGEVQTTSQTHLYLPAEDPALNVKVRDGQLQIKRQLGGPFRKAFGTQADGHCEQWGKWSFDLAAERSVLWDDDPSNLWVAVQKTRHQLKIPAADQPSLTDALPTTPPALVAAELTTLQVQDTSAWTFCVEAEGPVESLVETLLTAAPQLLNDTPPFSLSPDESYGYVRWLQQLPTVHTRPASEIQIPSL